MSIIEHATANRDRTAIIKGSLSRHVDGLRLERTAAYRARTAREQRRAFDAIDELQRSFRVLVGMANRFGLAVEAQAAERRVDMDELEIRAMRHHAPSSTN